MCTVKCIACPVLACPQASPYPSHSAIYDFAYTQTVCTKPLLGGWGEVPGEEASLAYNQFLNHILTTISHKKDIAHRQTPGAHECSSPEECRRPE